MATTQLQLQQKVSLNLFHYYTPYSYYSFSNYVILQCVFVYGDDALSGSNQFILILGAAVAAIVGFVNKVSYQL